MGVQKAFHQFSCARDASGQVLVAWPGLQNRAQLSWHIWVTIEIGYVTTEDMTEDVTEDVIEDVAQDVTEGVPKHVTEDVTEVVTK